MITYARLVPVEPSDPLVVATQTRDPLPLLLPPWTTGDTPAARLQSMQKREPAIYASQLFPVIPRSIRATALPPAVWDTAVPREERRAMWQTHFLADQYAAWEGDKSVVEQMEPDAPGLGIFGVRVNPLASVVRFMLSLHEVDMLMHYVAVVSLQFYLIKKKSFLRVRTDAAAPFSDALPPYLWMYFRKGEARMPTTGPELTKATNETTELMDSAATAAEWARRYSFPFFLLQVFRWVQHTYPELRPMCQANGDGHDLYECFHVFCESKIAKNTLQTMVCMRFRHFMPTGFVEQLQASRDAFFAGAPAMEPLALVRNKCFDSPNLGQMLILDKTSPGVDACVPFFFSHNSFQPNTPILYETAEETVASVENERKLIWKMMFYLPLGEFKVEGKKRTTDRWNRTSAFPTDRHEKLMLYDFYCPMKRHPIYSFYMAKIDSHESMHIYVPAMHLPANLSLDVAYLVPVADDADMRWMTDEAFEWCSRKGRVFNTLDLAIEAAIASGRVSPKPGGIQIGPGLYGGGEAGWTPWTAWMVGEEMRKPPHAPRDPFVYMKVVQLLTGVEEDGIATVAAHGVTLAELKTLSTRFSLAGVQDAHRLITEGGDFVTHLQRTLQEWDRCSPVPFPASCDRTVLYDRLWTLYFPPARVTVGGGAWIDRFKQPSSCMQIHSLLATLHANLSKPGIRKEMRACEGDQGYADLPPTFQATWNVLRAFVCAEGHKRKIKEEEEGSAPSSAASSPDKRARTAD